MAINMCDFTIDAPKRRSLSLFLFFFFFFVNMLECFDSVSVLLLFFSLAGLYVIIWMMTCRLLLLVVC